MLNIGVFDDSMIKELVDEVMKMKDFSHMNVLTLIGVALDSRKTPYLVMPFMLNGSLCEYLRKDDVRKELLWTKKGPTEAVVWLILLYSAKSHLFRSRAPTIVPTTYCSLRVHSYILHSCFCNNVIVKSCHILLQELQTHRKKMLPSDLPAYGVQYRGGQRIPD